MIEVTNIRVRSFDLSYLDIYWDVAPCFEDLLDYEFIVQVGQTEFGPYVDLTDPVVNLFHVRDNTVKGQHSYYHRRYYRVVARSRSNPDDFRAFPEVGGIRLTAAPDLHGLEMARINNLKLREFMGRKLWVFQRKQTGQRCGTCWDPVLSRKVRSGCPICFDTAWVGGFHAPVETYGMIVSPAESTAPTNFSRVQNENTTVLLGNYPEVSEGDVIVEAENIRWRVGNEIQKVNKARSLVRQQAPIHQIPRSDIEYSLPILLEDDAVRDLVGSPARNYTNPHTPDGISLGEALTSTFSRLK